MFTSNKSNSKDFGKKKILIVSGDQIIKIVFGNSKTKNDNLEKNIDEIGLEEEKSDEIYGNQVYDCGDEEEKKRREEEEKELVVEQEKGE